MKKFLLLSFFCICFQLTQAQNTFPTSGNVGIGTTSPLSGGGNSSWLTLNGTTNYSGGVIYTIQGVVKGYSYIDNDGLLTHQGQGTGQKFVVGGYLTAMTIANNGNVGIGTTSNENGFKFDVNGLSAIGNQGSARIYLGTTDATNAFIQSRDNSVNRNLTFFASNYYFSAGNVGVGVANPVSTLDVAGSINIPNNQNLTWGGAYGPNIPTIASTINNGIFFYPAGSTSGASMKIASNGNVGIGTTNPDEKLTVYGTVHARAVKVDLNGPLADFVFDNNYKLTPLNQVNSYITKHHHLSEMPGAKEAADKGIDLGLMNQKLLQKVEELTLYVIDLQKQVNTLKKRKSNNHTK